jgi:hypothetical protein
MARIRFYQFSLRRLFLLVTALSVALWLGLVWLGKITPQNGETLVTAQEQRVLSAMDVELGLTYHAPPVFT